MEVACYDFKEKKVNLFKWNSSLIYLINQYYISSIISEIEFFSALDLHFNRTKAKQQNSNSIGKLNVFDICVTKEYRTDVKKM